MLTMLRRSRSLRTLALAVVGLALIGSPLTGAQAQQRPGSGLTAPEVILQQQSLLPSESLLNQGAIVPTRELQTCEAGCVERHQNRYEACQDAYENCLAYGPPPGIGFYQPTCADVLVLCGQFSYTRLQGCFQRCRPIIQP